MLLFGPRLHGCCFFLLFQRFAAFPSPALAACLFTLRFRTRLTRGPKEKQATPVATPSPAVAAAAAAAAAEKSARTSCAWLSLSLWTCLSHFPFGETLKFYSILRSREMFA